MAWFLAGLKRRHRLGVGRFKMEFISKGVVEGMRGVLEMARGQAGDNEEEWQSPAGEGG